MSEQIYNEIGQRLKDELHSSAGKMFGKPCLKTADNKAFSAFFKGEMVFKLGQQEVNLLKEKYTGSTNWDPSGKNRPMKDWLQMPVEYKDHWDELARKALYYVNENK